MVRTMERKMFFNRWHCGTAPCIVPLTRQAGPLVSLRFCCCDCMSNAIIRPIQHAARHDVFRGARLCSTQF